MENVNKLEQGVARVLELIELKTIAKGKKTTQTLINRNILDWSLIILFQFQSDCFVFFSIVFQC